MNAILLSGECHSPKSHSDVFIMISNILLSVVLINAIPLSTLLSVILLLAQFCL